MSDFVNFTFLFSLFVSCSYDKFFSLEVTKMKQITMFISHLNCLLHKLEDGESESLTD